MILVHCEAFGYNVEPIIERLSPAWAKFKAESLYYSRAISSAASTVMSIYGILTGQYPAYSRHATLTPSYLRDTKELAGTWMNDLFQHKVVVAPESVMIARDIGFGSQMMGNYLDDLRAALASTPKPRLIYVYIPNWLLDLGNIHIGKMSVEESYLSKGTNITTEASFFDMLPKDELVVAYGDHGNTWLCPPYGHAVNVNWDTIRAPIAIRYPGVEPRVIDKLTSHLDLSLFLADHLGVRWDFPSYALEHGVKDRQVAYTRTCFALQGRMTSKQLWGYPPLVSVTDGCEQVVLELPITQNVGPLVTGSLSYFKEGQKMEVPSENQESMAKSLMALETAYRKHALELRKGKMG